MTTMSMVTSIENDKPESTMIKANYKLDKVKCLQQKLKACDRPLVSCAVKSGGNIVLELSSATFELVKSYVRPFYEASASTIARDKTVKVDTAGNVESEVLEVSDRTSSGRIGRHLYTINLYRTTSRILVNGPYHKRFLENDLTQMEEFIESNEAMVRENDARLAAEIATAMPTIRNNQEVTPVQEVVEPKATAMPLQLTQPDEAVVGLPNSLPPVLEYDQSETHSGAATPVQVGEEPKATAMPGQITQSNVAAEDLPNKLPPVLKCDHGELTKRLDAFESAMTDLVTSICTNQVNAVREEVKREVELLKERHARSLKEKDMKIERLLQENSSKTAGKQSNDVQDCKRQLDQKEKIIQDLHGQVESLKRDLKIVENQAQQATKNQDEAMRKFLSLQQQLAAQTAREEGSMPPGAQRKSQTEQLMQRTPSSTPANSGANPNLRRESEDDRPFTRVSSNRKRKGGHLILTSSLGKSLVERKIAPHAKSRVVVKAISGGRIADAARHINRCGYQHKSVTLLVGGNDIDGGATVNEAISDYEELLANIRANNPEARVCILAIPPRDRGPVVNGNIRQLNFKLQRLAERERCWFTDLVIDVREDIYDGVHLSKKGSSKLAMATRAFIYNVDSSNSEDSELPPPHTRWESSRPGQNRRSLGRPQFEAPAQTAAEDSMPPVHKDARVGPRFNQRRRGFKGREREHWHQRRAVDWKYNWGNSPSYEALPDTQQLMWLRDMLCNL